MIDDRGLGIDQDELRYYMEENPDMDLEEILDILEDAILDEKDARRSVKENFEDIFRQAINN